MKYRNEIIINAPRNRVVELFDNPENSKQWMQGLQSFTHLSGTPGHPGAKSKVVFQNGKRKLEMTETIVSRNLPDEFTGQYEANNVLNIVKNKFIDLGDKTQYINENEFRLSGIMKLMGWLMPGVFKKQSQKYLTDFKAFVESHAHNR